MRVLILGCGPAGLIAAHAAQQMHQDVLIFSKARKSHMFGAQYLHAPIPGITLPEDQFKIRYELRGTADGYHHKVYGPGKGVPRVSPQDLRGIHPAWDIRAVYDRLWARYNNWLLNNITLTSAEDVDSLINWSNCDLVISSLPAPLLCLEGHSFMAQKIWSSDQAMAPVADDTVVCNGDEAPAWYRASRIRGFDTVEWPYHTKPPLNSQHLWEVDKPLQNNCNCFPDVVRVGRYGQWTKGVLSHEAFSKTQGAIKTLLLGQQERLF